MGVVPSGAYLAKKLMLNAADGSGQWWWVIVLQGGAVFTAGYVVLVLVSVLRQAFRSNSFGEARLPTVRVRRAALSTTSLLLALAALGPVPGNLVSEPARTQGAGDVSGRGSGRRAAGARVVSLDRYSVPRDLILARMRATRRSDRSAGRDVELADRLVRRWPVREYQLACVGSADRRLLVFGSRHDAAQHARADGDMMAFLSIAAGGPLAILLR